MNTISYDQSKKITIFDDQEALITELVNHFKNACQKAIAERGQFVVALSGGSTPKIFLDKLSQETAIDWSKIVLFFSDERAVGPDHDDSNYKMAMHYLKDKNAKVFRMQAERSDRKAACKEYENEVLRITKDGVFDIVYLGMGTDGHTASLFPNTSVLDNEQDLVASCYVEEKKSWRMTFTFALINQAREIIILSVGKAKQEIFHDLFCNKDRPEYPVERVGTKNSPAQFFVDKEAISKCAF